MSVVNDDLNDTWVGHALLEAGATKNGQKVAQKRSIRELAVPALTGLVILTILAIQGFMLWQARQQAWDNAVRSGENVMRTLSDTIEQNLTTVDLALATAEASLENGDIDGLNQRQRDLLLFERATPPELVSSLIVASRRGEVIVESGALGVPTTSVADRDFFLAHVRRNGGTYLSHPFRSRFRGGEPNLAMSRRISEPDGAFNGAVIATIRLNFFRSLFNTVQLGPDGVISLVGLNGIMLMRVPSTDGDGNVGMEMTRSPGFEHMLISNEYITAKAAVDGKERLYVFKRVGAFPLLLSVGTATSDIYAEWWRQAMVTGTLTVAFCIALAFLVRGVQLGLARSSQMEQLLRRMSLTDVLTGLPNRRAFEERLDSELRRMVREGTRLAALLVDVDNFRNVNEAHGHPAGDKYLRMLARQIQRSAVRPGDVAARFGGEEFAVLLPSTDVKGAMHIAERIRSEMEHTSLSLGNGRRLGTTVSVGIVTVDAGTHASAISVLRIAEEALREAKEDGRNRVVWRDLSFPGPQSEPSTEGESAAPMQPA